MQGSVEEHARALEGLGCAVVQIRDAKDWGLDDGKPDFAGLIIPGGESTTLGKLLQSTGLDRLIARSAQEGFPIYGTCAGLILMAGRITGQRGPSLSLMDLDVERNAYGRQVESFEADLEIPEIGNPPFHGVFIRAPRIKSVGDSVRVLATLNGEPVFARQGSFLVSTFHPELTGDPRVHRYFVQMAAGTSPTLGD